MRRWYIGCAYFSPAIKNSIDGRWWRFCICRKDRRSSRGGKRRGRGDCYRNADSFRCRLRSAARLNIHDAHSCQAGFKIRDTVFIQRVIYSTYARELYFVCGAALFAIIAKYDAHQILMIGVPFRLLPHGSRQFYGIVVYHVESYIRYSIFCNFYALTREYHVTLKKWLKERTLFLKLIDYFYVSFSLYLLFRLYIIIYSRVNKLFLFAIHCLKISEEENIRYRSAAY